MSSKCCWNTFTDTVHELQYINCALTTFTHKQSKLFKITVPGCVVLIYEATSLRFDSPSILLGLISYVSTIGPNGGERVHVKASCISTVTSRVWSCLLWASSGLAARGFWPTSYPLGQTGPTGAWGGVKVKGGVKESGKRGSAAKQNN